MVHFSFQYRGFLDFFLLHRFCTSIKKIFKLYLKSGVYTGMNGVKCLIPLSLLTTFGRLCTWLLLLSPESEAQPFSLIVHKVSPPVQLFTKCPLQFKCSQRIPFSLTVHKVSPSVQMFTKCPLQFNCSQSVPFSLTVHKVSPSVQLFTKCPLQFNCSQSVPFSSNVHKVSPSV